MPFVIDHIDNEALRAFLRWDDTHCFVNGWTGRITFTYDRCCCCNSPLRRGYDMSGTLAAIRESYGIGR